MGPWAVRMTMAVSQRHWRAVTAQAHYRPARMPSGSRSTPSLPGSCGSSAIAAAKRRWSTKARMKQGNMPVRSILGGHPEKVELITASRPRASRQMRRIVLQEG